LKHTVIQKYFFLEILINVKAGRVDWGARKAYHGRHGARGRRVGQACSRSLITANNKFPYMLSPLPQ
jgi:hypothetical protein